jgi:hypothetical protein
MLLVVSAGLLAIPVTGQLADLVAFIFPLSINGRAAINPDIQPALNPPYLAQSTDPEMLIGCRERSQTCSTYLTRAQTEFMITL